MCGSSCRPTLTCSSVGQQRTLDLEWLLVMLLWYLEQKELETHSHLLLVLLESTRQVATYIKVETAGSTSSLTIVPGSCGPQVLYMAKGGHVVGPIRSVSYIYYANYANSSHGSVYSSFHRDLYSVYMYKHHSHTIRGPWNRNQYTVYTKTHPQTKGQ